MPLITHLLASYSTDSLTVLLPTPVALHAQVTAEGVSISEPFALDVKWDYEMFKQPTKFSAGAW